MTGNTTTLGPQAALRVRVTLRVTLRRAGVVLAAVALFAFALGDVHADALEKGRAAVEAGDFAAAAEHFADVLDKTPDDRAAALALTDAAIRADASEFYPVAEDALLTLRERNKRDYDVLLAIGRLSLAIGATKTNTLALKSYNAEALKSFETAAQIKPGDQDPVVGQARVHYESAFFEKAVEVVDAFLARRPAQCDEALFWKGQALYLAASDEYKRAGGAGALSDAIRTKFTKAQGAYEASARANPAAYETMIQLAYASAWLGEGARATAQDAYLKAALLEPGNPYPFMGLKSLYQHEPDGLTALLSEFVAKHPKHPQGLWYLATDRYLAKQWAAAAAAYEDFVAVAKDLGSGLFYLGKSYEGLGEEKKAVASYWKALENDPEDALAAWELELRVQKSDPMARARQSVKGAREVIAEYGKILKAAPKNHNVRNNLAFTLREAYVAHQGARKWVPILRESVKYYVAASEILGDWTAEKERTLDYPTRHAQAQVISDTGLMFQFYEPTRDLDKAIAYYERSLEYSEDGYWDAFNNLGQILTKLERWEELYELAASCAENLKTDKGQPDMAHRASAKSTADKLIRDGKVKD